MNNKYTPYTNAKLIFAHCDFEQQQQKRKKKTLTREKYDDLSIQALIKQTNRKENIKYFIITFAHS